ncbi:hypothetical protein [Ornithinibacillus xuwenensis]|uniref:Uncharacterized protein n=1 Tax=Ornithinibacillus xuwenensis TaxID=3144668 RepID=A0ABU9XGJ3_9BACI
MELLFLILIFAGVFAVYDAIRKLNNNLLEQTEEIKKMREELMQKNT